MVQRPDRVGLSVPAEVVRAAKTKAREQGLTLSLVVKLFLMAWLDGRLEVPIGKAKRKK